jgi:uncharacterized protein
MPAPIKLLVLAAAFLALSGSAAAAAPGGEDAEIQQWKAERLADLQSDGGWLTLVGLFWLDQGENTFGRAGTNHLVMDSTQLPGTAGSFFLSDHKVRFVCAPKARITHDGRPVTSLALISDAQGAPTILQSGSLQFWVIERDGHVGIRARDPDNPARRQFRGLAYFPVSPDWALDARFEPYPRGRKIAIVNILGMQEDMDSPGALVFRRNGQEWRLDAVLESPGDKELFIMFADGTSAHETYGGGRFLSVPLPKDGWTRIDFNKAYNPPCAFSNFATCPLPPPQNRLALRVEAGEMKYGADH